MANGAFTIGVISGAFLVRQGLVDVFRRAKFKRVVALGSSLLSTESLHADCARIERVDVAFFDIHTIEDAAEGLLPEQVTSVIRGNWPGAKIVALGTLLELAAHAKCLDGWIEAGRTGPDQLIDIASTIASRGQLPETSFRAGAIDRENARWRSISPRERQVLSLLGLGNDNLKMAAQLTISESSIKGHVSSLLRKFHAENRSELALIARAAGISRRNRTPSFRRD